MTAYILISSCADIDEVSFKFVVSLLGKSWEVIRRYEEVVDLLRFLREYSDEAVTAALPESCPETPETVKDVLNSLLVVLSDAVWDLPTVIEFFDPSEGTEPQVLLSQAHIQYLTHKVLDLQHSHDEMQLKLQHFQASNMAILQALQEVQRTVGIQPTSVVSSANGSNEDELGELANYPIAAQVATQHGSEQRASIVSVLTNDSEHHVTSPTGDGATSSAGLDKSAHSIVSFEETIREEKARLAAGGGDSSRYGADAESLSSSRKSQQQSRPVSTPLIVKTAPVSSFIPAELLPDDTLANYYDGAVSSLLAAVQGTDSPSPFVASVVAFTKRQVRLALHSNAFLLGMHRIGCGLPDDSICLSAIIGKVSINNWHHMLMDRLNMVAEREQDMAPEIAKQYDAEDDELLHSLSEDYQPKSRHVLSDIAHSKMNVLKVTFALDGKAVEVGANHRGDLIFLSFLEEVNTLVGKQHLFKRSLLLLRAWWSNETAAYVGTPIKHYLPDLALCTMVCAIFNQYHTRIDSPLQALCLFLAEYSGFDGMSQAITLQGLVPFKSSTSNQPIIIPAQEGHLIDAELIEKYWLELNVNYTPSDPNELDFYKRLNSSSEDVHGDDNFASVSINPHRAAAAAAAASESAIPPNSNRANVKSLSMHNQFYFDRQSFSIVHPFSHSNMMVEKLSPRRQMRLTKAFQIGAEKLTVFLRQSTDNENHSLDLLNYFPDTVTKYGDRMKQMQLASRDEPYLLSLNDRVFGASTAPLQQHINYCNIMLEGVVSESALLMLTVEILATKGSLPVGEIGKVLADITSIPNLSQKLKEKFGGLKKFLEHFQTKFVISNDHPFNPNVLLRDAIAPEHLELIDRGIFPHQLLAKAKRASAQPKRKKSIPESGSSGGLAGGSILGMSPPGTLHYGQQQHHAGSSKYYSQNISVPGSMGITTAGMHAGLAMTGNSNAKYGVSKHGPTRTTKPQQHHMHNMISPQQQQHQQQQQSGYMSQQMHMQQQQQQATFTPYGKMNSRGLSHSHHGIYSDPTGGNGGSGSGGSTSTSNANIQLGVNAQEFVPRTGRHPGDILGASASMPSFLSGSSLNDGRAESLNVSLNGRQQPQQQHQYQQHHDLGDSDYFLGSVVDIGYSDLLGTAAGSIDLSGGSGGAAGDISARSPNNSNSMLSSLRLGSVEVPSGIEAGGGIAAAAGGQSFHSHQQQHQHHNAGTGVVSMTANKSNNSLASIGSTGFAIEFQNHHQQQQHQQHQQQQILPESRFAPYLSDNTNM